MTKGHTTIALLQNGLNIEKPIIAAFPKNPVLSGVSLIGATETSHSHVLHDDPGVFESSGYVNVMEKTDTVMPQMNSSSVPTTTPTSPTKSL